jgi:RNA polymerase sigma-70 factor (family 1)
VKQNEVAEDIVQDCFIKLWNNRAQVKHPKALKSYLYTAVRNRSLDHLREVSGHKSHHEKISSTFSEYDESLVRQIAKGEMLNEIFNLMQILPPKCRTIFSMLYIEGKDYSEIAQELGLSVSTVKNQKAKAIQLLKSRLPHLAILLDLFFSALT